MAKIIKLTESDLQRLVRRIVDEQSVGQGPAQTPQQIRQDSRAQPRNATLQLNQSQLASMQQNLIKQFQQANGLTADGVVGKATYDAMVKKGILPNVAIPQPAAKPIQSGGALNQFQYGGGATGGVGATGNF
jgi:hypothetical protein